MIFNLQFSCNKRRLPLVVLSVLFCIAALFIGGVHAEPADSEDGLAPLARDSVQSETFSEIIPEMLFRPYPYSVDIVIDAGPLGRYRFSEDTELRRIPRDVRIRQELVTLLNDVQKTLEHRLLIVSGYRSEQHQIYLWATWLKDNHAVRELNRENYRTWEAWIDASQELPGCPPLATKHQTGNAVSFYWKGLDLDSREKRELLSQAIQGLGGEEKYSERDRQRFNIPAGDNARFEVTAYPKGDDVNIDNPDGLAYFQVIYRLSETPAAPRSDNVGTRERSDNSDRTTRNYRRKDIVRVLVDEHEYLATVMEDTRSRTREVKVWFEVDEIRAKVGDTVSIRDITRCREEPEAGWGKKAVALEYLTRTGWKHSRNVLVYRDKYLLPETVEGERELEFSQVRFSTYRRKAAD